MGSVTSGGQSISQSNTMRQSEMQTGVRKRGSYQKTKTEETEARGTHASIVIMFGIETGIDDLAMTAEEDYPIHPFVDFPIYLGNSQLSSRPARAQQCYLRYLPNYWCCQLTIYISVSLYFAYLPVLTVYPPIHVVSVTILFFTVQLI